MVAEELIFEAANKRSADKAALETYRNLKDLRTNFDSLNNVTSKIGLQEKLQRDLEIKIEQENARVSSQNFDRIKQDLESVQAENTVLITKIKAAT